ncbi:MAG: type II toxin-antitoxin system VapC family toxin [Candidatus Asgardarchaeia archaeon]
MLLVDSNIFIAAFNPRDKHHKVGKEYLIAIEEGKLGKVVITDYILDELLTYIRKKLGFKISLEVLERILSDENITIEKIDKKDFDLAIFFFEELKNLSFTDSTIIAFMKNRNIKKLLTLDSDFKAVNWIELVL